MNKRKLQLVRIGIWLVAFCGVLALGAFAPGQTSVLAQQPTPACHRFAYMPGHPHLITPRLACCLGMKSLLHWAWRKTGRTGFRSIIRVFKDQQAGSTLYTFFSLREPSFPRSIFLQHPRRFRHPRSTLPWKPRLSARPLRRDYRLSRLLRCRLRCLCLRTKLTHRRLESQPG